MREIRLLTPSQVAKIFEISEWTVRRLLRIRHIHGVKIGRKWRISEEEVLRLIRGDSND